MAVEAGIAPERVIAAFEGSRAAFGRAEAFTIGESAVRMMLIKNPTGANEVLRTLCGAPNALNIVAVLNDGIADGRDVSWIWDTDFELIADRVGIATCAGSRRNELALRLAYSGWPQDRITVADDALDAVHEACSNGDEVWVLATYTAMLDLRSRLERLGTVPARP